MYFKFIILVCGLGLMCGCSTPGMYKTKAYEEKGIIYIEQQGRGLVEVEKNADSWKIKADYKSVPLLMDVTKLVAVKEINKD